MAVRREHADLPDRARPGLVDPALLKKSLCNAARQLDLERVPQTVRELIDALPDLEGGRGPAALQPDDLRQLLRADVEPLAGSMRELLTHTDVAAVRTLVNEEIAAGRASDALAVVWHRHLLAERYGVPLRDDQANRRLRWKASPPETVKQFLSAIDVEFAASLGPAVAAACFSGPRRTRIVLAADAIHDAAEAEFYIYQLGVATFNVERKPQAGERSGFGCWIEYRKDAPQAAWCTLQDRAAAEASRDWAVCLMDGAYASQDRDAIFRMSKSLLRGAVQRRIDGNGVLRAILGDRLLLRSGGLTSMLERILRSSVGPKLQFTEHMLLVREESCEDIYLIWADPSGIRRRRWIPSRRVLASLGVSRPNVIPSVPAPLVAHYRYDGVLVAREHVEIVRDLLAPATATTWPWWPGSKEASLAGIEKRRSCLTLGDARVRVELVEDGASAGDAVPRFASEGEA